MEDGLEMEEGLAIAGRVVPASEKEPEGWIAADKFTVVLDTAGLNTTEFSAYCRKRELLPDSLRKNRLRSQVFPSSKLITLRSDWFSANHRLRTADCMRFALFGLPDHSRLATPLGNHLYMPPPSLGPLEAGTPE